MQDPTTLTRSLLQRSRRTLERAALVLVVGLGSGCKVGLLERVNCGMFEAAGPSYETTGKIDAIGEFGAALADKGEMVRQVDERMKASITHWNAVCHEFNAGARGHDELRNETQRMRRLYSWLWRMEHATDAASYQAAFVGLHTVLHDG